MKNELNRKIRELCDSAGTEAAQAMAAELTADMDKRFDDRVAAGMSELDAYRDVLRNVDRIEAMLKSLPSSDAVQAMENHRAGERTLNFFLGHTSAIMWVATVILFMTIGMTGGPWEYAWLLFLWTTVGQIMLGTAKRYNRHRNLRRAMRSGLSGSLWVGTTLLFFLTGFFSGMWQINWILYLFAVIVQILLNMLLRDGE